ncbi:uncharacterized protein I303_102506 [Kwoniella dejecticola CBS 10117]|uniref:Ubiquitin-like domain-containing protein n=1 Tax=Kwoniella dejecticola CBS 10117 TaxID=1296121 RepID=A0A1A6A8Y5_9TREE|nr:uncharacterized protein I303_02520 [Kwoniella dejecticola CBS 10117]OBR86512.1 hypothetical protein I303_02520 [Kwoniella dejecticola CBS 10117]
MSDAPLSGDRLNEERAFIKRYTEGLSSHKVEYPADFSTPLEDRPRKVAVVGVELAEPPSAPGMDIDTPAQDTVTITIKCLKPSLTLPITSSLTDTVTDLKAQIAKSNSSAPSVDTQRLLLKGKALSDNKLLKEYDIKDGTILHLMVKVSTASASAPAKDLTSDEATFPPPSSASPAPPALTITTSIDNASTAGTSMPLTNIDSAAPPLGPQPSVSSASFHQTISDPQFWQKIHALCVSEFPLEDEADAAWETFLVSMKGKLSAGEAAKIRDVVGVTGMGGQMST